VAKLTSKSNGKLRRGTATRAGSDRRATRPRTPSLEDSIVTLAETGKLAEAGAAAVRATKAAGLPVTFLEGNNVIREYPDGRREVVRRLKAAPKHPIPRGVARIPTVNGRGA
jgi:hypothetical protein